MAGGCLRKPGSSTRIGLVALLTAALFASGCQLAQTRDPNSPYYNIPRGSALVLLKPVTIASGQAHVKFQAGRVGGGGLYDVSCSLESHDLAKEPTKIQPDSFVIQRVANQQEYATAPKVYRFYKTFYLQSEKQPQITHLVCEIWEDLLWGRDISLPQVREALGDYFRIDLAGHEAQTTAAPSPAPN